MRFTLYNRLQGVTALFNYRGSFEEKVIEAEALARRRSAEQGISVDQAITLNFKERMQAQLAFFILAVSTNLTVVLLCFKNVGPEWALCSLAFGPGIVLLGAHALARKLQKD